MRGPLDGQALQTRTEESHVEPLIARDVDADGKVVCSQRVAVIDHHRCLACASLREVELAPDGAVRAVRCAPAIVTLAAG